MARGYERGGSGLLNHYLTESGFFESNEAEDLLQMDIDFSSGSGNILSITYHIVENDLYVEFHNGLYVYHDVPLQVAQGFEGAPSATTYLNMAIKGQYSYEQI